VVLGSFVGVSALMALGSSYPFKSWQVFGLGSTRNTPQFYTAVPSVGSSTHFYPGVDNTNDLGSTTLGFRTIYTNDIQLIGAASQINFGLATVAASTTTTSGNSQGSYYTAYLKDGGAGVGTIAAVEGSLICSTNASTNAGNFVTVAVCPPILDQTAWIGVAVTAASTGSVVNVYSSGWVLALTTGTVNAGDVLVTSGTVQGYLGSDTTPTTGADVGVAMGPGNANGGLTRIRLR